MAHHCFCLLFMQSDLCCFCPWILNIVHLTVCSVGRSILFVAVSFAQGKLCRTEWRLIDLTQLCVIARQKCSCELSFVNVYELKSIFMCESPVRVRHITVCRYRHCVCLSVRVWRREMTRLEHTIDSDDLRHLAAISKHNERLETTVQRLIILFIYSNLINDNFQQHL